MRKIWIVLLSFMMFTLFIACGDETEMANSLVAVRIDEGTLEPSYDLQSFNLDDLQLVLTYEDGSTDSLTVTPAMLSSDDLEALSTVGTHTVTIHYQAFSTMVVIHLMAAPLFHSLEMLYDMGVSEGLIAESYEEWLDSIRGADGRSVTAAMIDQNGHLVLTFSDGEVVNLGSVVGQAGVDAREIVLRVIDDRLEWQYVGEASWQALMDFSLTEQAPIHTVTFSSEGDVIVPSRSVRHGESLALPGAQRVGFFFEGWYSDDTLTQPFTSSTPIYDDLTLYAKWRWGGDYEIVDGRAHVTGGSLYYWDELVIPETLDGFVVERITEVAFQNQRNIRRLILPSQLRVIEAHAFQHAINLRYVELPEENYLTFIHKGAFMRTSIGSFPKAYSLQFLGDEAFRASRIRHFDFGPNLTTVGAHAFTECTNLRSVNWPTKVKTLKTGTFSLTTILRDLTFPEDAQLETIESDAFYYSRLPVILLPERLKTIESNALSFQEDAIVYFPERLEFMGEQAVRTRGSTTLTLLVAASEKPAGWHANWNPENHPVTWGFTFDDIADFQTMTTDEGIIIRAYTGDSKDLVIPAMMFGLPVIGIFDEAFGYQPTLETIILPPNLSFIGQRAFYEVTNLRQINLPERLVSIGDEAFQNTQLERIQIPLETTEIGARVFKGLPDLIISTDHLQAGPLWDADWNIEEAVVYFDAQNTVQGLYYETITRGDETVVSITGMNAFLNALTIPATIEGYSVVEIADEAFMGETQLERIILPESLWRIGVRAFAHMPQVQSIVFVEHNDLAIIDTEAFKGNTALEHFLILVSVTVIGAHAFKDCDNLTLLAEDVQRPFTWNFHWNSDDRPVTWGYQRYGSTEHFDYSVIGSLFGLGIRIDQYMGMDADVIVPAQIASLPVTHIGDFAFMLAPILESVTVPASVRVIGDYAFADSPDLQAVHLMPGSQLSHIGAYAFDQAISMHQFFVPLSVQSMGSHVFAGCVELTVLVEAQEAPKHWHPDWNPDGAKVEWGASDPFPLTH